MVFGRPESKTVSLMCGQECVVEPPSSTARHARRKAHLREGGSLWGEGGSLWELTVEESAADRQTQEVQATMVLSISGSG